MDYYRKLRKIKNLIKKFDALDILECSLEYLYSPHGPREKHAEKLPWLVFLIVKWSFSEGRVSPYYAERLSREKFLSIVQMVYELGDSGRMPGDGVHVNNFVRNMAYQQFIYQNEFSFVRYAWNYIVFSDLQENHKLRKQFVEKHGFSFEAYLEVSLLIFAAFYNGENSKVSLDFFSSVYDRFDRGSVGAVLNALSVDVREVKGKIVLANKSKGGCSEYFEQTPFIKYPLIHKEGEYHCLSRFILFRSIESFIYDTLKSEDPQKFMSVFGEIFERYLQNGLNYSGVDYVDENALKKSLPRESKVVDYIVTGDGYNVFIDAKGVEMPYLGKVSDDPEVILNKVKSSALKAIEQAFSVNEKLLEGDGKLPDYQESSFVLVVTYKELYLGNGITFFESVARSSIEKIESNINSKACIPMSNIYFITVECFDLMCSIVKHSSMDLMDILEHAINNDKDPRTKKFDFYLHLRELEGMKIPSYLRERIEVFMNKKGR